jgi:hypothetical protein
LPPVEDKPYPHFVPAVDRDGNEVTGIRLPDLTVPLATYTGWNLRHPQMGAPDRLMSLMGSTLPFPAPQKTAQEHAILTDRLPNAIPARPIISNRCGRRLYTSLMKATSLPRTWNL